MKIKLIKKVVFRDRNGFITHVFDVGAILIATAESLSYFVCSPGGIWKDEAILL